MASPKGRILCTEDDADTRELLILSLTIAGYDVSCTDRANTAVERMKVEKFDLCLVDNWMPGTSGEDLCKKIREFDQKVPIVALISASTEKKIFNAYKAGANDIIVKPVSNAELHRILTRYS